MRPTRLWLALLGLVLLAVLPARAGSPVVRLATLQFGTVAWALESMIANGDDAAGGFRLDLRGLAGTDASRIALQAGDADMIAADWVWVSRQRAAGQDLTFLPFSTAVGALMVPADSPVKGIADLAGRRIGVAGGPLDKSWIFLQAVGAQQAGLDIAAAVEPVFGAPPLLSKTLEQGRIDGVLTYWHYAARLQAAGYRTALGVDELVRALGGGDSLPVIGFVFHEGWARTNPALAAGFARALARTQSRLLTDDAAWEPLREVMRAGSEAEFIALRDGFRAGIPRARDAADVEAAAGRLFAVLSERGGETLVGAATTLQPGTFWHLPD